VVRVALFVFLCGASLVHAACASSAADREWAHNRLLAERSFSAGDVSGAIARFQELERRAIGPRDLRAARLRLGDVFAASGALASAREAYARALEAAEHPSHRARVALRMAQLDLRHSTKQASGFAALWALVRDFPNTVAAVRALDTLLQHYRALDSTGAESAMELRFLLAVAHHARTATARVGEHARLRAARILMLRGTSGAERALELLSGLGAGPPQTALYDDALFARVEVLRALGRHREAIDGARFLLSYRERPRLFGNYETRFYHRVHRLIVAILRDDLRDLPGAERALTEFVQEFAFSRQYDDALFELGTLRLSLEQPVAAREAFERLVRERPESRFARRAQRILDGGADPGEDAPWQRPAHLGQGAR
jgi:tetratricopeptide (TPR) repeat protein